MKAKSLLGAYAKIPSLFMKRCQDLERWLHENADWDAPFLVAQKVAMVLVAHDIADWKILHTVTDEKMTKWFKDDKYVALLRPLVEKLRTSNELEFRAMSAKRRRMAGDGQNKMIPGLVALGQTTEEHLEHLGKCLEEAEEHLGVHDLFDTTPAETLKRVRELKRRGKQIEELLFTRADQCALATRSGSMASVNSALKCWISFAQQVLDYPDGQEVPPKQETDVVQYLAIFRNSGTAANYLGILKWYCLSKSLDVSWATPRLRMQLKGLKKLSLRSMAGKLITELALITWDVLNKVVGIARILHMREFMVLHLFCWLFLTRVQSEALPLEAGCEEDFTGDLPQHRHSAVMVGKFQTDDGLWWKALHVRWQRRKNRVLGSSIKRVCGCKEPEHKAFCAVCQMELWLNEKHFEPGDLVFPSFAERKTEKSGKVVTRARGALALHQLRTCLGWVAEAKNPKFYTLKTYRAGRATDMAAQGFSLGEIQLAGEWSSTSAPFSYMNTDVADRAQELKFMVNRMYGEMDEGEEDAEEPLGAEGECPG